MEAGRSEGRAPRWLLAVVSALPACAAPDAELHLAPVFSRHTLPGYDHAEAAGGALRYHASGSTTWALSPLYWRCDDPDGRARADFLFPLGRYEHDPERPRTYARLFPLFWRTAETRPDGVTEVDWSALFPFFWGGSASDGGESSFAFFPVYGRLRDFFTYDEIRFVLWPLYMSTAKGERRGHHVLWPLVGWLSAGGEGWHVFPLYGTAEAPGRYRRSYLLWPIAHWSAEDLDRAHPRHGWLVVPLGGQIRQGDYTASTVLWPVFGYAERPSTGYRSFAAWPLVKFESGGRHAERRLSRLLPFWIRYEDESTEFTAWMWPIFWIRQDHFGGIQRDSFYALPFYFRSCTRSPAGTERKERLWPLVRAQRDDAGGERFALLAPGIEPILSSDALSRNLGFAFEVWAGDSPAASGPRQRRAFLNLYHSAEYAGHRRWSVPVLGGQWTEPDGTVHTSLLLGLIRFRSGAGGGFEEPAFPGPGWPDLHGLAADGGAQPPAAP